MTHEELDGALLEETLSRLLSERCGPTVRQAAERDGWARDCWDALAETGLARVGIPEAAGGSGGGIQQACTLVRMAGRHAVPLPLAEGSLLGGWMASAAGLRLPDGPVTVALPRAADNLVMEDGRASGELRRVPWGSLATVVALARSAEGDRVVLLDPNTATVAPGRNLAGERRDRLRWSAVEVPPDRIGKATFDLRAELELRGALSRALLMAGAMETVASMSVEYAHQRHQFGRPVASFQAVAQRLVRLSSEAEAGLLASEVAALQFAQSGAEAAFEIGAAKVTTARAGSEVAAHAHQIHGAIGMTQEYPLHHFTRRLWTWRQEWGSERYWASALGEHMAQAGADALWPRVATGLIATP